MQNQNRNPITLGQSAVHRRGQPPSLLWRVVGRVLLVAVSFLGVAALLSAWQATRLASLPVTPLEPLTRTADLSLSIENPLPPAVQDGARVRVEGFLRAEPPLQNRFGSYALQKLSVSHLQRVSGRSSSTRQTDAVEQNAPRLWLYLDEDAASRKRVEVQLPRLWDGDQLSIRPIRGHVGVAGTIPNNVFQSLALEPVQPERRQDWELWSIRQNERVTVVAKARLDTGRVLLEVRRGIDCLLSPAPWPSLMGDVNMRAGGQLVLGLLCLLPLGWKGWKWARSRRAPASTWSPGN